MHSEYQPRGVRGKQRRRRGRGKSAHTTADNHHDSLGPTVVLRSARKELTEIRKTLYSRLELEEGERKYQDNELERAERGLRLSRRRPTAKANLEAAPFPVTTTTSRTTNELSLLEPLDLDEVEACVRWSELMDAYETDEGDVVYCIITQIEQQDLIEEITSAMVTQVADIVDNPIDNINMDQLFDPWIETDETPKLSDERIEELFQPWI